MPTELPDYQALASCLLRVKDKLAQSQCEGDKTPHQLAIIGGEIQGLRRAAMIVLDAHIKQLRAEAGL